MATQENIDIVKDQKILAMKNKVMQGMKWNSLLVSVSEVSKFVAAPLVFIGASTLLVGGAVTVGVALVGAAAALMGTAIASSYVASRIGQSSGFDNLEINAQSTARHLVQELKANNLVVAEEHTQNQRADGQKWTQVVRPGSTPSQQIS